MLKFYGSYSRFHHDVNPPTSMFCLVSLTLHNVCCSDDAPHAGEASRFLAVARSPSAPRRLSCRPHKRRFANRPHAWMITDGA